MLTSLSLSQPQYLLFVDCGALPLRGGGTLLLVLRPTRGSCRSSVVGAGRRGGRLGLGTVVVTQLGEPAGQPQYRQTE